VVERGDPSPAAGASTVGVTRDDASVTTPALLNCAVCGEPLPARARFCSNCGAPVETTLGTDERKMITVVFADLVDSTGLARRLDPERAREVLGHFFDVASEELLALRGRPEKFIGDAVMAVFGLPTVHEDDALRAVRAGLAIRGRMRRLAESLELPEPIEVHVGIESGEAATGIGPAGQLLVTGPMVNAAARLQDAAEPSEVLVGETTFALTETAVKYGARRDIPAKGFDGDLVGFPVEGISTRSRRRTIPFVGRGSELTILRETLARVSGSGRPALVTVVGEPGIGKSRLADELVAGLDEDVRVARGLDQAFSDTATFAPAAAIVGDLAAIDERDPPDVIRRKLRDLVGLTSDGHAADATVERLSLLFGTAERRQAAFVQAVQTGTLELIDSLARDRTLLLVFEDAQTIRPAMLDLIERLATAPRKGRRRAMVLALARPALLDERPIWGSSTVNAVTIRLDPLTLEESLDLVRQAAGGRIDDAEASQIAVRAGGNPFFIVETTGMLLPDATGAAASRGGIPPTVQAAVSARLDHLPPRLRELARRASAFFVSFDLDELRVVDPDVTRQEVGQLEEAEIVVREEGKRAVERWRVRHATVKDVAYASLPKRERVRLHELIAERLMSTGHQSWAADHLELAARASLDLYPDDRALPERAADALVAAGDRARRRMEIRGAIDYYERALGLSGPEERWGVREARALAGMGEAYYWLGEYRLSTERSERAVELGGALDDPFALALALRFLGDIAINVDGDLDRAEELLDRSLEAAERMNEPWAIARTLLFAGWVPWNRGDRARGADRRKEYDDAEHIWRRALAVADPDDGWARVRALNSLSIGRDSRGDLDEALRLSNEATALAERIGDQFSIAITSVQRGRVLEDLGRFEDALPCVERGIAIFDDLGARWELADATAERGDIRRELGDLDGSEEDLTKAVRITEELGDRQLAGWLWRSLAKVSERRGNEPEAGERMRRSREAQEWLARAERVGAPRS
jgi:class 3 adenylate cyclase/tetratricopeptide (TPR) repeat protein